MRMDVPEHGSASRQDISNRDREQNQRGLCLLPHLLRPLLQKPYIPVEEQLQIIHSILQQSNPVRAHAKRKSRNFLGVVPVVLHKLKYIRIHHAAPQNLNPPRLFAWAAGIRAAPPTPTANEA